MGQLHAIAIILIFVVMAAGFIRWQVVLLLKRKFPQLFKAETKIGTSNGQFVLVLRPFVLDGIFKDPHSDLVSSLMLAFVPDEPRRFEDFVRRGAENHLPVVVVANPRDYEASPYGDNLKATDHTWRKLVREQVQKARFVILVMGPFTPGFSHEFEFVINEVNPNRFGLIIPPVNEEVRAEINKVLADVMRQVGNLRFPLLTEEDLAVSFSAGWRTEIVRGKHPVSYSQYSWATDFLVRRALAN